MIFEESQSIELKTSLNIKSIIKAIVAFANSDGGRVLVGISDNGEVCGIDIGRNTMENLATEISKHTDPSIKPIILVKSDNKKEYIEIIIEKSTIAPHFADYVAYKRSGKTSQKMSSREIEEIIGKKDIGSYDSMKLNDAKLEDLSKEKIRDFLEHLGKNYTELNYLRSRNCVRKDEGVELPTIAGMLLFGKNPQKFLVQSHITLVDYTQKEDPRFKVIENFDGTLIDQLSKIIDFTYRIYPTLDILKEGSVRRKKLYRIPPEILREVIVNCLVHRVYEDYGRKIVIKYYKDRIEITNPASLRKGVNVTDLADYQYSRNPVLSRVFFEAGFVEEIGEGVDKILDWASNTGLQKSDVYQFNFDEMKTTLFLDKPELLISKNYKLNERQGMLLKILSSGESYASSELADQVGSSSDTILNDIKYLNEYVKISSNGSGRSIKYNWIF